MATLVILADLREDWLPGEDVFRVADFESCIRFPVCKLVEKLKTEWAGDRSLPVQVARAQIEALRTTGDPEARYRAKWLLVRQLYELGYNEDEVREAFRIIDWMMRLRDDLSLMFERELTALEESLNMPYVTSVERIAEARGEARGAANVLLKALANSAVGRVNEETEQRVRDLSIQQLESLSENLSRMRSPSDLVAWLDGLNGGAAS